MIILNKPMAHQLEDIVRSILDHSPNNFIFGSYARAFAGSGVDYNDIDVGTDDVAALMKYLEQIYACSKKSDRHIVCKTTDGEKTIDIHNKKSFPTKTTNRDILAIKNNDGNPILVHRRTLREIVVHKEYIKVDVREESELLWEFYNGGTNFSDK